MQPLPILYPPGSPTVRSANRSYPSFRPAPAMAPPLYGLPVSPPTAPACVSPTIKLDLTPLNELMKQYTQFARQPSWFAPINPLRGALIGAAGLASVACVLHGTLEATLMNGVLGTIAGASIAAALRKKNSGHSTH